MSDKMNQRLDFRTDRQMEHRVAFIACVVSFCLVALQLWNNRDYFDPDGISYLDMADAYSRGDWQAAINAIWSPFYSWLLALMMIVFKPSGQWEFTAVHGLNLFVYPFALAAFSVFMWEFLRAKRETGGNGELPDWAWLVFGYSLFTWSNIRLIPPHLPEPDLLISMLVYLIFAMLFRLRRGAASLGGSIFLGVLLGIGYLTKPIMFPMAFVFLGVALVLARRSRQKLFRIVVTFLIFLSLSIPYIVVLSEAKGRWTYSDSGKLNYAWDVNGVKLWIHWQGGPAGHGIPVHPTRKIHDDPPMYEFKTPIKATYPPFYDPSYWYEGVKVKVDLQKQLRVFVRNAKELLLFFSNSSGPVSSNFATGGPLNYTYERTIGPLLTLLCVMVIMNLRVVSPFREITRQWFILIPIGTALGLYTLLHLEARHIGAYVVVLWMGLFRSVGIAQSEESKRALTAVLISATLIIAITLAWGTGRGVWHSTRYLVNNSPEAPFLQSGYSNWKVADYLHNKGVRAGDPVGAVGDTYFAYWARMARVHIVAEIPKEGEEAFWALDKEKRAVLMQLFRAVGAKGVVASDVPVGTAPANWKHIKDTGYYVFVFPNEEGK